MRSALFRPADRPLLNLALLALTVCTTLVTFHFNLLDDGPSQGWSRAWMFSLSALFILGSHEMGHYLAARAHGVDTSLPYFIPLPFGFGTLGAVIRIRSPIPSKNALIDIGAAGPLAGLIAAIPVLLYGYAHSAVEPIPVLVRHWPGEFSLWALGEKLFHYLVHRVTGEPLVAGPLRTLTEYGDSLLMLCTRRIAVGPLSDAQDVVMHPCLLAGWFGMIVTMMNLIPIGQLDGGHVAFANFGVRARTLGKIVASAILVLCLFVSAFWIVWFIFTTRFIGFRHPDVVDPVEPLSPSRKWISVACLVALVICAIPIPITELSLP